MWLQSWGPLYAILHRIALGEAAERMGAVASMPGGDVGISLVAQAGIRAVAADVAVMSGYLSMSVPFLAAALAYGVGRATSLASSVLHVGQEAAIGAAREGSTGNLSLGSTQVDSHRYATLEGRQVRTSAQVDTGRYSGYTPEGAAYTVAADGTAIADASAATSRLPAAGIRLSESLAASHENRAAQSRTLAENFSAEAAQARTAAATDATAMVERHARDVNVGTAHAHGVTESESRQAQDLSSHVDRLSEIAGITQDQAATLTAEASLGGGFGKVVRVGASGRASWRGQTIESEAFNRMADYAEQNRVLDLWSQVAEASRRYSTATGEERACEPGGELREQPHADGAVRGPGLGELQRSGELERAGRAGARRGAGDRPRPRPAVLHVARRAARRGRAADRRRRGPAAGDPANARGSGDPARVRRGVRLRTAARADGAADGERAGARHVRRRARGHPGPAAARHGHGVRGLVGGRAGPGGRRGRARGTWICPPRAPGARPKRRWRHGRASAGNANRRRKPPWTRAGRPWSPKRTSR